MAENPLLGSKTITVKDREAGARARDVLAVSASAILGYLGTNDEAAVRLALDLAVDLFKASGKRINVADTQPAPKLSVAPAAAGNGGGAS